MVFGYLKILETRIRHVQRHIMVFIPNRLELIDRYRLKLDDGDKEIITNWFSKTRRSSSLIRDESKRDWQQFSNRNSDKNSHFEHAYTWFLTDHGFNLRRIGTILGSKWLIRVCDVYFAIYGTWGTRVSCMKYLIWGFETEVASISNTFVYRLMPSKLRF